MSKQELCSGPECDREIHNKKRRLCKGHYGQWYRGVDPLLPLQDRTPRGKKGEYKVGYMAAHGKLRDQRGQARGHLCQLCNGQAAEWALLPEVASDPNCLKEQVLVGGAELAFSMNVDDYRPLCRLCHAKERTV